MLKEILKMIDEGDVSNIEELAKKLGTEKSVLKGQIQLLVDKGYLSSEIPDPKKCEGCALHSFCIDKSKAYFLTEKGKKLILL